MLVQYELNHLFSNTKGWVECPVHDLAPSGQRSLSLEIVLPLPLLKLILKSLVSNILSVNIEANNPQ